MERRPPKQVPCTYPTCQAVFKTEDAMKKHKISNTEHEYCGRCDEDFYSEEHLLIHKIKSKKHIVCPICATDFRSEGGRDSHIRQNHRAEQNIICYGCSSKFKSASGLMRHIEDDECPEISQTQLLREQSKKLLIKEALEYGESSSLIGLADPDPVDGGVKIPTTLEEENREAMKNQPNHAQDDLLDTQRLTLKHWPFLGDRNTHGASSPSLMEPSDLVAFSNLSLNSLRNDDKEDKTRAWQSNGKVPSVIDPDFTYTASAGPFGVGPLDAGMTLRTLDHSWDPTRFFNSFSGFYVCPCGQTFTSVKDFEEHVLLKSKSNHKVQCPGCLRLFKTTAALIAHCESPSTRCDINEGNRYGQIIDELSGGVIQAAGYNEDGTLKYEAGKLDIQKTTTIGVDLRKRGNK